jgi:DNA repair exonuclease SbcCD nuclease subunit
MKFAVISDTHAGVRNSSDIFIDYQERFYSEIFFPYLLKNNITKILHLGDYYEHRKYINFKALNANRLMFLEKLREYGITMYIVAGNHDLYYKSTNELCALNECLGHYMDCVVIYDKPTVLDCVSDCRIAMIPWISPDNEESSLKFIDNVNADVVAGHFEFGGFEMNRGIENAHGMSTAIFNRFEQVWSGHYHTKSIKGNITYFGSQMEFNWNDAGDAKFFHIFDSTTREVEANHNPLTMFEYHYYNDKKHDYQTFDITSLKDKYIKIIVESKEDSYIFERFINRIEEMGVHELRIADTLSAFTGKNVDATTNVMVDDTPTLLSTYIDGVSTDLDKPRIKDLMNGLYIEAQNVGVI